MPLREVVLFPDPRLKLVSKPIDEITDEIRQLAADMIEVMYDEPGIGLAAPQVGVSLRMFVIDTEWSDETVGRHPLVVAAAPAGARRNADPDAGPAGPGAAAR